MSVGFGVDFISPMFFKTFKNPCRLFKSIFEEVESGIMFTAFATVLSSFVAVTKICLASVGFIAMKSTALSIALKNAFAISGFVSNHL
jgi:hypothetical protein